MARRQMSYSTGHDLRSRGLQTKQTLQWPNLRCRGAKARNLIAWPSEVQWPQCTAALLMSNTSKLRFHHGHGRAGSLLTSTQHQASLRPFTTFELWSLQVSVSNTTPRACQEFLDPQTFQGTFTFAGSTWLNLDSMIQVASYKIYHLKPTKLLGTSWWKFQSQRN